MGFALLESYMYICMYVRVFVFVRTCGVYMVHTGMGAYVCIQACRGQGQHQVSSLIAAHTVAVVTVNGGCYYYCEEWPLTKARAQ